MRWCTQVLTLAIASVVFKHSNSCTRCATDALTRSSVHACLVQDSIMGRFQKTIHFDLRCLLVYECIIHAYYYYRRSLELNTGLYGITEANILNEDKEVQYIMRSVIVWRSCGLRV